MWESATIKVGRAPHYLPLACRKSVRRPQLASPACSTNRRIYPNTFVAVLLVWLVMTYGDVILEFLGMDCMSLFLRSLKLTTSTGGGHLINR